MNSVDDPTCPVSLQYGEEFGRLPDLLGNRVQRLEYEYRKFTGGCVVERRIRRQCLLD